MLSYLVLPMSVGCVAGAMLGGQLWRKAETDGQKLR
jgi:hypothetical protein